MIENRQLGNAAEGAEREKMKTTLAYTALVAFSFVYFFRPEDLIPGLPTIPLGKITGAICLLALILGVRPKGRAKLPLECKLLLALLVQMILTIPFAYWRGGAFDTVVNKFSKGVIAAFLISLVVTRLGELRKLLYIQGMAVALVTAVSVIVGHTEDGRLMGIQKGILENPNDLAINIAINFPLCMAFLFGSRSGLRKVLWGLSLICMLYAVVATYSRSGLLAMMIAALICLWEFGMKGRRILFVMSTGLAAVIVLGVMFATPHYLARMKTIVGENGGSAGSIESHARGSVEARTELLKQSWQLARRHPLFGIGPGNFPIFSGHWLVAHNTYTEIAAEAGFPGLILFVAGLGFTLAKIRRVPKLAGYARNQEIQLWTSGLSAAMVAYIAGAAFASTEYELFPYFMVGYICALYNIAKEGGHGSDEPGSAVPKSGWRQLAATSKYETVESARRR